MSAAALNLGRIQSSSTWMSSSLSRGLHQPAATSKTWRVSLGLRVEHQSITSHPSTTLPAGVFYFENLSLFHTVRGNVCVLSACVCLPLWTCCRTREFDLSFIPDGSTEGREVEHRGWISDQRRSESIVCVNYPDWWFQSRSCVCVCVVSCLCLFSCYNWTRSKPSPSSGPAPWPQVDAPCPSSFIPHPKSEQRNTDIFPPLSGPLGRFYYWLLVLSPFHSDAFIFVLRSF